MSPDVAADLAGIEAALLAPGSHFETHIEDVAGVPMSVFRSRHRSLRDVLAASAGFGEREYVIFGDRRITYAEHYRLVCATAAALRERFGVQKGDRVAILASNKPEWVIAFWAAISLGALPVGLNGWWVRDEILFALKDCVPKVLFVDRKRLARAPEAREMCPTVVIEEGFDALTRPHMDAALCQTHIDEDDPAAILYSSGTTGRPKGIVATHRNIIALTGIQIFHGARASMLDQLRGVDVVQTEENCALVSTPLFHVSGLYAGIITRMVVGAKTVWTVGRFDAGEILEIIQRERVSGWGPTATMVHRVLAHPDFDQYDLSSMRFVGLGGSPVSEALMTELKTRMPSVRTTAAVGYGLTEACALATITFGDELAQFPTSVGRPLPTVEVSIRDDHGVGLPDGEIGEIWIRSPLVMQGYWRNPEATAERITGDRWLRTGDIGFLRDGRLHIASRRTDLIIRGGENIYPAEIEAQLALLPGIDEVAVVGVPHEELGQECKAILVPLPGATPDIDEIKQALESKLAYFKIPAHWEIRREPLPRNASGKVMKPVLMGAELTISDE